ncbi:MAG: hypothetical protein Q4D91_13885 [Lautropia sp.]|nr:hypothetical protein [Lautropia sp.]
MPILTATACGQITLHTNSSARLSTEEINDAIADAATLDERFDALSRRISDAWADIPEAEGIAGIEAAVAAERACR